MFLPIMADPWMDSPPCFGVICCKGATLFQPLLAVSRFHLCFITGRRGRITACLVLWLRKESWEWATAKGALMMLCKVGFNQCIDGRLPGNFLLLLIPLSIDQNCVYGGYRWKWTCLLILIIHDDALNPILVPTRGNPLKWMGLVNQH